MAATAGSQHGRVALTVTAPHFHALDAGMETLSLPAHSSDVSNTQLTSEDSCLGDAGRHRAAALPWRLG